MRTRSSLSAIAAASLVLVAARPAAAADTGVYLPQAVCLLWDSLLLAVHASADSLIALSYVTISATLGYLVYRARRDVPFHWMTPSFGVFLLACGLAHFAAVLTLWLPWYWMSAAVKTVTAVASVATAILLPPLVPAALAFVRAARLSDQRERTVRASEARFRGLLESAPDAIVIVDEHGGVLLVNEQAEHVFGYRRDELLGRPVENLLPESLRERHIEHQQRYRADPRTRPMGVGLDLSARRKDGTTFPAEISLSPLRTDEGLLITTVIRDVTERKHAEEQRAALVREQAARAAAEAARQEAEAARRLAESASRMKDEFLATVSHELRTPLTAVLGWAKVLRNTTRDLPASVDKPLDIIERNAAAQAQLIDDLLDVSRIVAGQMHIAMRPVDLGAGVDDAIEVVRPTADARGVRLSSTRAAPTLVLGDARRLQQVVWNLLSNAVKFTPRGGEVAVAIAEVDGHATVTVRDTGKGIDASFLPHLFEPFRQADAGPTRKHGGLGLGLAIVRHLVELHGGSVRAESAGEGRGSVFTVTLPLTSLPAETVDAAWVRSHRALASGPARLDGYRVLVVEDEADTREMLASALTTSGAIVNTAGSVRHALDLVELHRHDAIVADIGMPDEDGYSFIRRVRAAKLPHIARIPAIALTAYTRQQDRDMALAAGFHRHLPKPVDPVELTRTLREVLTEQAKTATSG